MREWGVFFVEVSTILCVPRFRKPGALLPVPGANGIPEGIGFARVTFQHKVLLTTCDSSCKSALHGLIHWLANAYCKAGITVNGVAPALIEDTAMLPGGNVELAAKVPVGRLGKPEEVAETVLWMVRTGYVTNKVIAVDVGMYVQ